jgi:hypothetical protein
MAFAGFNFCGSSEGAFALAGFAALALGGMVM